MKLIVITSPDFLPDEAQVIAALFRAGLDLLHLRKPGADISRVRQLVREIPWEYRQRIVIHDFFSLQEEFALGGIHLNSRHAEAPERYRGMLSRACQSFILFKYLSWQNPLLVRPLMEIVLQYSSGNVCTSNSPLIERNA